MSAARRPATKPRFGEVLEADRKAKQQAVTEPPGDGEGRTGLPGRLEPPPDGTGHRQGDRAEKAGSSRNHRPSQGRQQVNRKVNLAPAEANPGQAIAQNRPAAMQVSVGLTAMSAPFAFGCASPAKASLALPTTNVRFPTHYVKSGQPAYDPIADVAATG